MKSVKKFRPKTPFLAVDPIVKSKFGIAMIKRKFPPHKDAFCLPGGFVKIGESVEQAVIREAREELGIPVRIKKLVGVYSSPSRDPRFHAVSVAFLCKPLSLKLKAGDDAVAAFWVKKKPKKIGFDYLKMFRDAGIWK